MNILEMAMAAKMGGGKGGGVLNWDDLTNKPFEKTVTEINLVSDEGFVYNEDSGAFIGSLISVPVVGETYTINYNGTEYKLIAVETGGGILFGNLSALGEGEDTGEPFLMIIIPEQNLLLCIPLDGAVEVSVEIWGANITVKKLDRDFYDAPGVFYIKSEPNAYMDDNSLYNDPACEERASYLGILKFKYCPIVIMFGNTQYQPDYVDFYPPYGTVTLKGYNYFTTGG